eukprot:1158341-Pelagomonas_calceolata.AAC.7
MRGGQVAQSACLDAYGMKEGGIASEFAGSPGKSQLNFTAALPWSLPGALACHGCTSQPPPPPATCPGSSHQTRLTL